MPEPEPISCNHCYGFHATREEADKCCARMNGPTFCDGSELVEGFKALLAALGIKVS